ncbi:MAG: class I SAM-dependent methyltransferase [Chloroflexota bacterium]
MNDFNRYLLAKRTIDDRALNRYVWQRLQTEVARLGRPLHLLEVGAGVGTMVERLVEWGLLSDGDYTAVDANPDCIANARRRLGERHATIDLIWQTADLFDFAAQAQPRRWDLLIAHALLDLLDLSQALPLLFNLLKPGGLFYFTLNFDGGTIFQPSLPGDRAVEQAYHQTMDSRPGGSQTGRRLFHQVQQAGGKVLALGSSDWVVHPVGSTYPADEAFFLHFILDTMAGALNSHPDLDSDQLQNWLRQRRSQVEAGQLVYIAHQLDMVGVVRST